MQETQVAWIWSPSSVCVCVWAQGGSKQLPLKLPTATTHGYIDAAARKPSTLVHRFFQRNHFLTLPKYGYVYGCQLTWLTFFSFSKIFCQKHEQLKRFFSRFIHPSARICSNAWFCLVKIIFFIQLIWRFPKILVPQTKIIHLVGFSMN